MTDELLRYYDQSIPPDLLTPPVPPVVPSTGATAGIPGTWTPPGSTPPATVAALIAAAPPIAATPTAAWTTGQYVQTATTGVAGRAHWSGTAWIAGAATVEEEEPTP